VSHAHSDHIAAHDHVLLSEATSLFMRTRLPGRRTELILELHQRVELEHAGNKFHLTMFPAGHIFGSGMALIEAQGESLLYTGDFKLRESLAAEKCVVPRADLLIMETTFGLPRYRFPPEAAVRAEIVKFCHDALTDGATPVLHGYSLGKSQEILRGLEGADLPVMLQRDVRKMTKLYEKLGMQFPAHEAFEPESAHGKVIICPQGSLTTMQKVALGKLRSAAVTGWAMDSSCRYRSGTDAAFALSDHADYDELLELVKLVQPKKVFTVHGFAREFAADLRKLGVDANAPGWHEQLALL
jgi:Cft2 family RNA processing exonuclease